MSSPGGSFLVNLGKGLAGGYLNKQEQERQLNKEKEEKQFRLLQDAFDTAEKRGDTSAMAHIFRSMEEFTSASGAGRGGKTGRAQQQGILSVFADAIEKGVPTASSKEATSRNEELISQGKPEQATRPRKALTPLFRSNEELEDEQTRTLVKRDQALLPGKIALVEATQAAMARRQAKIQNMRDISREKLQASSFDQRANLDVNKVISELMAADPELSPEEARLEAGNILSTARQLNLDHINSKIETNEANVKQRALDSERRMEYWNGLLAQGQQRIAQGDARLAQNDKRIELAYGDVKTIQTEISGLDQEMIGIVIQQNRERQTMGNPNATSSERKKAEARFAELDKQYSDREKQRDALVKKQEDIKNSLREEFPAPTSTTGTSGKSLGPKKKLSKASDSLIGKVYAASELPAMAREAYPNDLDGVNKIRKAIAASRGTIAEDK